MTGGKARRKNDGYWKRMASDSVLKEAGMKTLHNYSTLTEAGGNGRLGGFKTYFQGMYKLDRL